MNAVFTAMTRVYIYCSSHEDLWVIVDSFFLNVHTYLKVGTLIINKIAENNFFLEINYNRLTENLTVKDNEILGVTSTIIFC